MAVPDFQSMMKPLLTLLQDGAPRTHRELKELLAKSMRLSDQDRAETLSSGQARFDNRFYWAGIYLTRAALTDRPRRGTLQVTDRGKAVLKENPTAISIAYLMRFSEFAEFRGRSRPDPVKPDNGVEVPEVETRTPDEVIGIATGQVQAQVQSDLLVAMKSCSAAKFELLALDFLSRMGFGVDGTSRRATGRSGDGGIDGFVDEDRLGVGRVYLQAKKYEGQVPIEKVREFIGVLTTERAQKGVLITTGSFSKGARDLAERSNARVVLIDGEALSALMIKHGIGVQTQTLTYARKLDLDYFDEE